MLELIIKNGTVIDGSGAPPVRSSVGVRGDRIVSARAPAFSLAVCVGGDKI